MGTIDCRVQYGPELVIFGGGFLCVPVAQRIARWTSNPKVVGSIPTRDEHFYFNLLYYLLIYPL